MVHKKGMHLIFFPYFSTVLKKAHETFIVIGTKPETAQTA